MAETLANNNAGGMRQAEDFEFAALAEAANYRAAIARLFAAHLRGDILEVGAGVGQMLRDIIAICRPASTTAIEPDPRFAARLRHACPGTRVIEGTIQDLPPAGGFDAIIAVNVLEHIEQDTAELSFWRQHLRPGSGQVCLLVPARPEIYAPIDADFGHFRRYTKDELRDKLAAAGFRIKYVRYYNLVGYFAWLVNFKILRRRHFDVGAVRTFDRLIFPASHHVEQSIGWCPFGQSLVAVADA